MRFHIWYPVPFLFSSSMISICFLSWLFCDLPLYILQKLWCISTNRTFTYFTIILRDKGIDGLASKYSNNTVLGLCNSQPTQSKLGKNKEVYIYTQVQVVSNALMLSQSSAKMDNKIVGWTWCHSSFSTNLWLGKQNSLQWESLPGAPSICESFTTPVVQP